MNDSDDKQPTQRTPTGHEIPVPTRKQVMDDLLRVAHPRVEDEDEASPQGDPLAGDDSYALGGLAPGREVEVQVINHAFGSHIVRVTPL